MIATTLDAAITAELGARIHRAWASRTPIAPLTDEHPEMTTADAYAVQRAVVERLLATGDRIVGWKLGLTSRAMQEQLGVDQPDYGPILSGFIVPEGRPISLEELIQPRIEAEIAFVLRGRLQGPGVTALDVLEATAGVAPALEIIDSRIAGWRIRLADTIADVASSARVVAAGTITPAAGLDLRTIGVVLERRGEIVATGAGAAALGNPAEAVAWAANTLGPLGVAFEPGQIVMPGALHASVSVAPGDSFRARFDRLGSVTARFT